MRRKLNSSRNDAIYKRTGSTLEIGNYKFEIVKQFRYLDLIITSDNDETTNII